MPRSPSHATLEATTGKRLAAQLYVTHCLKTDSVEGQAGLSIRATSIHDPAFYKYALDFPSYKIPLDMVAALPTPLQAPRRLALVPTLGGKLALVQSSYVQKDTLGRGGNFFSHFLIYDRISPREALRSWGSPQWQVEYPEGTTQDLPAFPGVPAHGILNDEALATFLTSAEVHADQDLATALYPTRLAGDPECRMRWLRAAIQGYLLARQAGGSGRCRLYILAEPGVVALLLYGIARLLPERLVEDLTFTTYEPSHTSLREFRDARVIGTYTSNLLRGLEADYLNRLGFGIDTFRDKLSPELLQSSLRGCETLLNLAAERDWDAIDELHELWAHDPRASADSLGEASQIQAAFRILSRGEPAIDDLLALQKSPLGQRLLQRPDYQARAWPLVRAALLRPDVAQAFSSLIREPARLRELKAEWCRLLAAGQVEDWKALWDATRRLFVREELLAHLNALLRELKTDDPAHAPPLASRLALLREWQALEPSLPEVRAEHAWLLAASGPGELKELARSGIPGRWVGQACCLCLQGAPSPAVIESIRKADDSLLRGFCEAVSARPDANEILARLLPADDPAAPATFDRLFREGLTLPPASLDALLTRIGADQTTWEGYWRPAGGRTGDHFVAVLSALDPGSAFATRLWNHFCQRLSD
ncbi:MAG TPA: hypothetical protein VGZ22_21800, partial [Isosphaeraceae bacterium]|nr:hypothetical protein [Isosphaeraceae bacterium]